MHKAIPIGSYTHNKLYSGTACYHTLNKGHSIKLTSFMPIRRQLLCSSKLHHTKLADPKVSFI